MANTGWILAALAIFPNAMAVSETNFAQNYRAVVEPFLARHATEGSWEDAKGRISFRRVEPEASLGSVVIVPGVGESYVAYGELMHDLARAGLRVFALDPRGQGLSQPVGIRAPLVNIDTFETHVADLERFIEKEVKADAANPVFLYGGSTGAVVAGLFAARNPSLVRRLALSSPLMEPRLAGGPQNSAAAFAFLSGQVLLGKALQPAPLRHFAMTAWQSEDNPLTSSLARRIFVRDALRASGSSPNAGVTILWAKSLADASYRLEAEAYKVKAPTLMFQAGADTVALSRPQDELCRRLRDCKKVRFDQARHKIFFETDVFRGPALEQLLRFFDLQTMSNAESFSQGNKKRL